jgi:hypothetical protein
MIYLAGEGVLVKFMLVTHRSSFAKTGPEEPYELVPFAEQPQSIARHVPSGIRPGLQHQVGPTLIDLQSLKIAEMIATCRKDSTLRPPVAPRVPASVLLKCQRELNTRMHRRKARKTLTIALVPLVSLSVLRGVLLEHEL